MTTALTVIAICAPWALAVLAFADGQGLATIELRGGAGSKQAKIVMESPDGIEISVDDGAVAFSQFLRWDQIRTISGDESSPLRMQRVALGELLWRGRIRLSHGDATGARKCFAAAAHRIEAGAELSRMMAAEGIATTAASSDADWVESIEAAMTVSALRGRIAIPEPWMGSVDQFDREYGLLLSVAPAWTDGESAKRAQDLFDAAADRARRENDLRLSQLIADVARIAGADAGLPRPPAMTVREGTTNAKDSVGAEGTRSSSVAARTAAKKGAKLIALWADSVSSDSAVRKRSRQSLAQIVRDEEGLARVWAIYAEGRSLAMESDPEEIRRGVGKMLMVPAAYGAELPRLADAALAQSAIALAQVQDDESAATLRRIRSEYESQFRSRVETTVVETPAGNPPTIYPTKGD